MKYEYFMSCRWNKKNEKGFSSVKMTTEKKIKTYEHLMDCCTAIEREYKYNRAIILNYKLLKRRWF